MKTPRPKMHVSIEMAEHNTVLKLKEKIQAINQFFPINRLVLHAVGNKSRNKLKLIVLTKCGTKKIAVKVNPLDNVE